MPQISDDVIIFNLKIGSTTHVSVLVVFTLFSNDSPGYKSSLCCLAKIDAVTIMLFAGSGPCAESSWRGSGEGLGLPVVCALFDYPDGEFSSPQPLKAMAPPLTGNGRWCHQALKGPARFFMTQPCRLAKLTPFPLRKLVNDMVTAAC